MHLLRTISIFFALILSVIVIEAKPSQSPITPTFKESIRNLLQLTGIENEYARFLTYMRVFRPNENPTMRHFYDELFSDNAYITDVVQVYAEHFTPEEVHELIKFYSSPLGKKAIQLNNDLHKIMEDTMLTKISDYIFTANENGMDIVVRRK